MTLVEVLVAAFVASIALLALLGTAFTAYKINHKARLRDNARAVLRTYVDQFQRLGYANESNIVRMLFTVTDGAETGLGLRWGDLSDQINYEGSPQTLEIDIGSPGAPQLATVTRQVSYVGLDGSDVTTRAVDAAGFMMRATFTVTYYLGGSGQQVISQSMSTLRLID